MTTTYKIIHPAHISDWVAIHAAGKVVRWVDPNKYGVGDVPNVDDADCDAGCIIIAVEA